MSNPGANGYDQYQSAVSRQTGTTSSLAAGAVFATSALATGSTGSGTAQVFATIYAQFLFPGQGGAAQFQYSNDGQNWAPCSASMTIPSSGFTQMSARAMGVFMRTVFTNGSTAQTSGFIINEQMSIV